MWLMKTLLTSGCTNQLGAGQAEYLEKKRREVGNTIHKGVLRDATKLVRDGKI